MAYYDNPGQINDEALSIAGGRTYQVIQIADSEGNIVDPATGEFTFDGEIEFPDEFVVANTADTPVNATLVGKKDEGNSTTTNLAAGATFTGVGIEASPLYGTISVCILSSHNSATNGLKFQASIDNISWENIEQYNYVAANGLKSYSFSPSGRYFRLTYTNGATPTTKLAIFTVLRSGAVKASSHRVKDNIDGEHDAELVKAVLAAEMPSGTFTDINATAGGNLKISLEEVNGIDPLPTTVPARTPTTTSVPSSATSVTILASNANRKGFSISNVSTAKLYLSFTNPATTTNAWIEMPAGAFLLLDQQLIVGNAIYGIWASANGTAQVTEYV
jgi:hypothetical protein